MRLTHLFVLFVLSAAAPAFAGSDPSDAPNPFADQPAAKGNITSVDKGVGDFSTPLQPQTIQQSQNGEFIAPPSDQNNKNGSSDGFYQSSKKSTDDQ